MTLDNQQFSQVEKCYLSVFQYIISCKNRNEILLPDDPEIQSCNELVYSFFLQSVIYIALFFYIVHYLVTMHQLRNLYIFCFIYIYIYIFQYIFQLRSIKLRDYVIWKNEVFVNINLRPNLFNHDFRNTSQFSN